MKNSFKRFLGMVIAVGVAGSTLCAPAQVFAADSAMFFSDDFQAYAVSSSLITGPGTSATDGVWKMSSNYCGWDNGGGSAVCAEGENKYLQLHGFGTWNAVLAEYTTDYSMLGPDVEMKIDYRRNAWDDSESGIRFMVTHDENSYYELYSGRYGGKFRLRKVADGAEKWDTVLTTFDATAEEWFTLSLKNNGDTLLWSVTKKSDNNTAESGRIADRRMFALRGGAAKYQISITGDSNAYYDNFSLNNIEASSEYYVSRNLIASDSFESYEVMAEAQYGNPNATIGSCWQLSPTYRGSSYDNHYIWYQLVDFQGASNMLRFRGYGSNDGEEGCFNYTGDLTGVESDVKMSVDMKFQDVDLVCYYGGIRFIAHNSDKNYYGLYTGMTDLDVPDIGTNGSETGTTDSGEGTTGSETNKTYTFGTWFVKVVNGDVVYRVRLAEDDTDKYNYYTYTMEKIGNEIKYSVIDKTSGTVAVSGTYTDTEPFDPATLDETYQLMVWREGVAYFDNFRLTGPEIPVEPIDGTVTRVVYSDDKSGDPASGYTAAFSNFEGIVNEVKWKVTSNTLNYDVLQTCSDKGVVITGKSDLLFALVITGTADYLNDITVTATIE